MNVLPRMPDDFVPEGRSPLGSDISEQVFAHDIDVPFNWKTLRDNKLS